MLRSIRKAALSLASITLLLPLAANAQSVHFDNLDQGDRFGMTVGAKFTMPLGTQRKNNVKDKTRFGLTLSFDRTYRAQKFYTPNRISSDILEFGFLVDGKPNMMMYGEDIYTPFFAPVYADDTDDKSEPSNGNPPVYTPRANTSGAIIILGGIAIVGTVVLVNESVDRFSDCFLDFSNDPRCN